MVPSDELLSGTCAPPGQMGELLGRRRRRRRHRLETGAWDCFSFRVVSHERSRGFDLCSMCRTYNSNPSPESYTYVFTCIQMSLKHNPKMKSYIKSRTSIPLWGDSFTLSILTAASSEEVRVRGLHPQAATDNVALPTLRLGYVRLRPHRRRA